MQVGGAAGEVAGQVVHGVVVLVVEFGGGGEFGGERVGPPGGEYANELFTGGVGEVVVYRPVRRPRPSGRIEVVELPAAEFAVAVHRGPHDDIDVTNGRLGAWVVGHALAVDGPIRETYLVGPRDTEVSARWRTEIGWPVFRLSAA